MNKTHSLLIEFLTEELPPQGLQKFSEEFTKSICKELKNFICLDFKTSVIATPRRFGCLINGIKEEEPDTQILRKGPPLSAGMVDNKPTKALTGFMASANANFEDLEQKDGYYYVNQKVIGRNLIDVLVSVINSTLKKLPITKYMRWGNNDFAFVRPVHNLLIMLDDKIIKLNEPILGINVTNYTYGHRFLSQDVLNQDTITIKNATDYFAIIKQQGMVYADFDERKNKIKCDLIKHSDDLNLHMNDYADLLEEVTAITEYPIVLKGEFKLDYLQVPAECLVLSMAKNQKYFALFDKNNNLTNKFLFVANVKSTNSQVVIHGNECVINARLADAQFFFDTDKKQPLKHYVDKLSHVIYHNKIGSQLERIERLEQIAMQFAPLFNLSAELAGHAASLIKFDLTTEMVGEFPELQGVMGKYYALWHNELEDVANSIEQHYYPRFSGDALPNSDLAILLALADKLETLVGIWGIGMVPTGDKDPFALRRMALGVVRILLKYKLDIKQLIDITFSGFKNIELNTSTPQEVHKFIVDRLMNYLNSSDEFAYPITIIKSAVLRHNNNDYPTTFTHLPSLLQQLNIFAENPDNTLIIEANKRIENILNSTQGMNALTYSGFDYQLEKQSFTDIENDVFILLKCEASLDSYAKENNWLEYFRLLVTFNTPINNFFTNVMVMDEDLLVREKRANLLKKIAEIMNKYCRISWLVN